MTVTNGPTLRIRNPLLLECRYQNSRYWQGHQGQVGQSPWTLERPRPHYDQRDAYPGFHQHYERVRGRGHLPLWLYQKVITPFQLFITTQRTTMEPQAGMTSIFFRHYHAGWCDGLEPTISSKWILGRSRRSSSEYDLPTRVQEMGHDSSDAIKSGVYLPLLLLPRLQRGHFHVGYHLPVFSQRSLRARQLHHHSTISSTPYFCT
jgi:hypothetical protein